MSLCMAGDVKRRVFFPLLHIIEMQTRLDVCAVMKEQCVAPQAFPFPAPFHKPTQAGPKPNLNFHLS